MIVTTTRTTKEAADTRSGRTRSSSVIVVEVETSEEVVIMEMTIGMTGIGIAAVIGETTEADPQAARISIRRGTDLANVRKWMTLADMRSPRGLVGQTTKIEVTRDIRVSSHDRLLAATVEATLVTEIAIEEAGVAIKNVEAMTVTEVAMIVATIVVVEAVVASAEAEEEVKLV